jgi:hypothetical protein
MRIFNKNSADKIGYKKDKEIKISPLMPIRVKQIPTQMQLGFTVA